MSRSTAVGSWVLALIASTAVGCSGADGSVSQTAQAATDFDGTTHFADGAVDLTSDRSTTPELEEEYHQYYVTTHARPSYRSDDTAAERAKKLSDEKARAELEWESLLAHDKVIAEGMTAAETLALFAYTSGDSDYEVVNAALRNGSPAALAPHESWIKLLAAGLNQLPPYKAKVFRRTTLPVYEADDGVHTKGTIRDEFLALYAPGKTEIERSFLSASQELDETCDFSGNARYVIHPNVHGHAISDWSSHPEEDEVLFSPGVAFHVDAVTRGSNDKGCDRDPGTPAGVELVIELTEL